PINATIVIKGELIDTEGTEYYNTANIKVILSIKDGNFTLGGLFGGDETLGRVTNAALNQFSPEVVEALTPALEQLAEEMIMKYMKSFTGSVPYYTIFPKLHNLNKKPNLTVTFKFVLFHKASLIFLLGPMNPTIRIEGELVQVNGVEYYNTINIKVTESIRDLEVTAEGLFGHDEELGRITNHMLNRFSVEITQAATPVLEQFDEKMFMGFMKSFTGSVPYYKIFPRLNNYITN
ncbi:hypothetical protein ILUMI_26132, partial [Ignelater luminosus]